MLSPQEQMELLRQHWAAQAARFDKPDAAWLVLNRDGVILSWSLHRRSAERTARKIAEPCHVARLDPRDF